MTRYFYTDLLAAAWMAKHFGMRFREYTSVTEIAYEAWKPLVRAIAGASPLPVPETLLIHPDSLHLLEPRAWDIGQRMQGVPQVLCPPADYEEYERHGIGKNYIPLGSLRIDREFRILQRDGKPFFWPEREE